MSFTVVPAVIPQSLSHLESVIETVRPFVTEIQIDVVDGVFVENVSWPYGEGEKKGKPHDIVAILVGMEIEMDLMIHNPLSELPKWLAVGARRVVVHMESCTPDDLARAKEIAHASGARLGIASQNHTPLEAYLEALRHADFAQCMGIPKIGVQGQPFDERVLDRIKAVHEQYPDMEIAVDGSVNLQTAGALTRAGATRLIAGSSILAASDPAAAYHALMHSTLM